MGAVQKYLSSTLMLFVIGSATFSLKAFAAPETIDVAGPPESTTSGGAHPRVSQSKKNVSKSSNEHAEKPSQFSRKAVDDAGAAKPHGHDFTALDPADELKIKHSDLPKWYGISQGFALAKRKRKLIMIDVYTDWCGWCKVMDRAVFPRPEVAKLMRKFVLVKCDAEDGGDGTDLARLLGVNRFPASCFLDPDLTPRATVFGFRDPETYAEILTDVLEGKVPEKRAPKPPGQ